jgi:hypothetical protein
MVFTNIVMDYIFDDIQNNKNDEWKCENM